MTLYAFDGASAFDLAAAKRHGGIVASCYIVGNPGGFPHADKARVAAVRAARLGALPNWERTAGYFLTCTLAEARAAGVEALNAARAAGFPDDGSIRVPFSFDAQIPAARYPEMGDKIHACGVGMAGAFQPMLYAQSGLIEYVARHGQAPGKHWLMGSTWGQPYAAASPNVCMVQSHDAAGNWLNSPVPGTDINTVTDPNAIGAWWPDGSPYGDAMPTAADVWAVLLPDPNDPTHKTTAASWLTHTNDKADQAIAAAKAAQAQSAALAATVKELQAAVAALAPGAALGGTATVTIDLAAK